MDWDLARIFLAVARTGQLLGAARQLGLDHATVSRRVNALERSLGVKLLDRRTTGCVPTAAGEAFLLTAERVETEMLQAQAALAGPAVAMGGQVRIGAPDGFGTFVLARHLAGFVERHPGLVVQLVPLPRTFSLAKREADIAITIEPPAEGRLTVKKLTDYRLGLYATRDYLARHPPVVDVEAVRGHRIVTYVRDLIFAEALDYLGELRIEPTLRFECASVLGQMEAVRAGCGIGVLHAYAARLHADLVPVLPHLEVRRAYWIVVHDDVKDVARVRAAHEYIAAMVEGMRRDFL